MNKVRIFLDNVQFEVDSELNALQASNRSNIFIPSWCAIHQRSASQVCRLCIVEIEGIKGAINSCSVQVQEGMKITVNSVILNKTRKTLLELLLKEHKGCEDPHCELEALGEKLGISKTDSMFTHHSKSSILSDYLSYDADLCIHCERCISTCTLQKSLKIETKTRNISLKNNGIENDCIQCGDCIYACGTGALKRNNLADLRNGL